MKTIMLWLCLLLMSLSLSADETLQKDFPGLFANVDGVAQNDVLNVRQKASYQSKKISSLLNNSFVMVDYCKNVARSTWCKISPSPLVEDGGNGWVNARYLKFSNRGYVSLLNRQSICDYSLRCKVMDGIQKCLVVTDVGSHDDIQLSTEWIERKFLKPETNVTAADDPDLNKEGGYCIQGRMIEDYLRDHPEKMAE